MNKLKFGQTEIHEAGHAVIAEHFGVRVQSVSVGICPDTGRKCGSTKAEGRPKSLKDDVVITLAGHVSEEEAFGQYVPLVRQHDLDLIDQSDWTNAINPDGQYASEQEFNKAKQQLIQEYEVIAKKLVHELWPQIARLAEVLSDLKSLSGEQVRETLSGIR
jgi:membrane-associated protease RseP (regulator of RpoE activity)